MVLVVLQLFLPFFEMDLVFLYFEQFGCQILFFHTVLVHEILISKDIPQIILINK